MDKRRVELKSPIKTAGEHEVEISLYREIKGTVKVLVGSEADFAAEAAEEEVAEAAEAEVTEAVEEVSAAIDEIAEAAEKAAE